MKGPSIGATTSGEIDLANRDVELRGVIVPPSASNPGDFSFIYKIAGPLQGPVLKINPLSALAPKMFRKLSAPIPRMENNALRGVRTSQSGSQRTPFMRPIWARGAG
jgi:hypothetical protein